MSTLWIPISIFAAAAQAVRTAAQKELNATLSNLGTTYVRAIYGMPVVVVFLMLVMAMEGSDWPKLTWAFAFNVALAALTQVLATVLLIEMFRLKDFAVGTMLTKFDVVIAAILGAAFFGEPMTAFSAAALAVVMTGVLLLTFGRVKTIGQAGFAQTLRAPSTLVAAATATLFALSFLYVRESVLTVGQGSAFWKSGWAMAANLALQILGVGAWLSWREPGVFAKMLPAWRISTFIGVTSALGSLAWFAAFALANPAYVRAVGQIEVVFTLLIAKLRFGERPTQVELSGIGLVVLGVLLFRLLAS